MLPWGSFLSFTDQKGRSPWILCLFLPREGADLVQEEHNASIRVGSTAWAGDRPKCVCVLGGCLPRLFQELRIGCQEFLDSPPGLLAWRERIRQIQSRVRSSGCR